MIIKKLKKLGMNALLGVGQGSIRERIYLVTLEWNGTTISKPLAFVEGVCFDTGGYSLKPSKIYGR